MEIRPDIRIEVRSDPRLLQAVRKLIRAYLESEGFDEGKTDDVVLAVDEACTNAIRHSYGGSRDGGLLLEMAAAPGYIEFELNDEGEPAPADCTETAPTEAPDPATLKPGGLGIALMQRVFDEVRILPGEEKGNRVVLRLARPQGTKGEVE